MRSDNPDALEQIFQGPLNWVNLGIIGINIVVFLVLGRLGSTEDTAHMMKYGAAYTPLILDGEWYRLFTCMFLHFDFEHLLNNMLLLLFIGDWVEGLTNKWKYLIIYLGGGIIGNLASLVWDIATGEYYVSAGASGAVYAVLGAFFVILIKNRGQLRDMTASRVGIVLVLAIYNGMQSTGIDNAAHLGGAIGGMILTLVLYHAKQSRTVEGWNFD